MQLSDLVADVQSSPDKRNIALDRVGIKRLKHPMTFVEMQGEHAFSQSVVGVFSMFVDLAKNLKGTHMSRFVALLNEQEVILSVANIPAWMKTIASRLQAGFSYFEVTFPFFIQKAAPISHAKGLMDYEVTLQGCYEKGICTTYVSVLIPVTSLCPCSKEISAFGAHNQRSHLTITLEIKQAISLIELIQLVESKASCELYSLLKRSDEKEVTERAFLNPKFVEDMVRDIASTFDKLPYIHGYKISSENFESIHNHSAFAEIDRLNTSAAARGTGRALAAEAFARSSEPCV